MELNTFLSTLVTDLGQFSPHRSLAEVTVSIYPVWMQEFNKWKLFVGNNPDNQREPQKATFKLELRRY